MKLPPKRKRKPNRVASIRCPGHKADIKRYGCALERKFSPTSKHYECSGPIDPHHVIYLSAGGGDDTLAPLCRGHHDLTHEKRKEWIEAETGVDLLAMGAEMWRIGDAAKRYRIKHRDD